MESDDDVQAIVGLGIARALVASYAGRHAESIEQAERAIALRSKVGYNGAVIESYLVAANESFELSDVARASRFVAELEAVPRSEGSLRLRAGEVARGGDHAAQLERRLATCGRERLRRRLHLSGVVPLWLEEGRDDPREGGLVAPAARLAPPYRGDRKSESCRSTP